MQYLQNKKLNTSIVVSFGIKKTNLVITDLGLLNLSTGKITNRVLNSVRSYIYTIDVGDKVTYLLKEFNIKDFNTCIRKV